MTAHDDLQRRLRHQVASVEPDAPTIDSLQSSAVAKRRRRTRMGAFAAAVVLAAGALGAAAVLSDDSGESDRAQIASPAEDSAARDSAASESSDGFEVVDLDYGTLPITWQDITLPAEIGWVERIIDTGDGVLLVDGGGAWTSRDLATWTPVQVPDNVAGGPGQNGYMQSVTARGDIIALVYSQYSGGVDEPDFPETTVAIEVDDLTVSITNGGEGQIFVVSDSSGAEILRRSIDFRSSFSPEVLQYRSQGSLRLLDDAGNEVVTVRAELIEEAFEEMYSSGPFEGNEDWDPCQQVGNSETTTVYVSRDGGGSWVATPLVAPATTSSRIMVHRQVEVQTDGQSVVGTMSEFSDINIECAVQQAGIDVPMSMGYSVGSDQGGVRIDTEDGSEFVSWADLGLTDEEVAAVEGSMGPEGMTIVGFEADGSMSTLQDFEGWGTLVALDNAYVVAVSEGEGPSMSGLRSSDGGVTWVPIELPAQGNLAAAGGDALVLGGWENDSYLSTDAGISWSQIPGHPGVGAQQFASADGKLLLTGHVFTEDMMGPLEPVSIVLEKDGYTINLTDGRSGMSAIVTDADGNLIAEYGDEVEATGLPEGIEFGDDGTFRLLDADGELIVELDPMAFEEAMNEAFEVMDGPDMEEEYEEPEMVFGYLDGDDWIFAPVSEAFGGSAYVMAAIGLDNGFLVSGDRMAPFRSLDSEEETFETNSNGPRLFFGSLNS
ncbi:MAG: hypothetical protein ACI8Y4_002414 [Candidatus Poriferisodalaceae bacterium]|jgi:hypothetical protein